MEPVNEALPVEGRDEPVVVEDAARALEDDEVLLLDEVEGELLLEVWEPTGEPRVDAALDLLSQLDPDDVAHHREVFDDVHQRLRATLTDLDAVS